MHSALPPQSNNMSQHPSPPTKRGICMANAFLQVFKYSQGNVSNVKYDIYSTLYYNLFNMDYTEPKEELAAFIKKNYAIMFEYMSSCYSSEYKRTDYFKHTIKEWTRCKPSEIIYALSTEHKNCFHILDLIKSSPSITNSDMIMWVIYDCYDFNSDLSGDSPRDPHEVSITTINTSLPIEQSERPTPVDTWTYHQDGVIGSADY
jgi:hypothetical protein